MKGTMKCVVQTERRADSLAWLERPIPQSGSQDVLVKVKAAAICGTDVHIQDWEEFARCRLTPPRIIGHEFAGEIVEIGSAVTGLKPGDIVSAETHVVCHRCGSCRNGCAHVCSHTRTLGLHLDGAFAEYIAVPAENIFVCDPAVPMEVSALMEPLGAAVHTALAFPIAGKTVAVVGCGPIGVMGLAASKKVGAAKLIGVEINQDRAELARAMGADAIVNPVETDAVEAVKRLTGGDGVDIVLEFSGNTDAIRAAVSYLKPAGKMAALGLPGREVTFDMAEFVYRGLTLQGIAGRRMYQSWEQMKGLLAAGLDVSKVITHVLPLAEYEEGLRLMRSGACCKCILIP